MLHTVIAIKMYIWKHNWRQQIIIIMLPYKWDSVTVQKRLFSIFHTNLNNRLLDHIEWTFELNLFQFHGHLQRNRWIS